MDEHNDAFYHWHLFIEHGYISSEGNYLLHIDHHDDYECGGYDWDLTRMPAGAEEALRFVDQAVGIADFIVPALWQGIFSTVHIMKNLVPLPFSDTEDFVRIQNGCELIKGTYTPLLHRKKKCDGDENYRFFTHRTGGLMDDERVEASNIVLDVDLDYFCWDNSLSSTPRKRIEITETAYREFMNDRNHPFRILPVKLLSVEEENRRFYLVYREQIAPDKEPDEARIVKRMDRLFQWFQAIDLQPAAIDVCRSSFSGYLPQTKAAFVEEQFMKRLCRQYDVDMVQPMV